MVIILLISDIYIYIYNNNIYIFIFQCCSKFVTLTGVFFSFLATSTFFVITARGKS